MPLKVDPCRERGGRSLAGSTRARWLAAVPLAASGLASGLPLMAGHLLGARVTPTSIVLDLVRLNEDGDFRPLPDAALASGPPVLRAAYGVFFLAPYLTAAVLAALLVRGSFARGARGRYDRLRRWPGRRAARVLTLLSALSPLALAALLTVEPPRQELATPAWFLTFAGVAAHALVLSVVRDAGGAHRVARVLLAQTVAMTPIVVVAAVLAVERSLGLGGFIVGVAWVAQFIWCIMACGPGALPERSATRSALG